MDPVAFVDREIAIIHSMSAPWEYVWLIDLRGCEGFVTYTELQRLAAFWNTLRYQIDRTVKTAVVTLNPLSIARLPTINLLYPRHILMPFDNLDYAEAWLDAV